jgi:sugar/nucleoside kinase (ribokinase family)
MPSTTTPGIEIYGIGNPLIDVIIRAEEIDLTNLNLAKGIMRLVDLDERRHILSYFTGRQFAYSCGGSCPNTLIFLSSLGINVAIAGKIGYDEFGRKYEENLPKKNLLSQLIFSDGPTGSSIILVSPDSERTMNTYLGVNRQFSRADIDFDVLSRSSCLYFTGYMWDTEQQKESILKAIKSVRSRGGLVAFDVADPFAVDRNREAFIDLIDSEIDIVFANREEAKLLYNVECAEDAAELLGSKVDIAVVKDGSRGSMIKRKGRSVIQIPVRRVEAVDTTGAGDMYAAGFLYGIFRDFSDKDAGVCASYLASRIVETWGAQFDPETRAIVAEEVKSDKWRFTDE